MNEKATNQKSILDGVPVEDKAFPLSGRKTERQIVSKCPQCGAPIYGDPITCDVNPVVVYSCSCLMQNNQMPNARHT